MSVNYIVCATLSTCLVAVTGCDLPQGEVEWVKTWQQACYCEGVAQGTWGPQYAYRSETADICSDARPTQIEIDAHCAVIAARLSGFYPGTIDYYRFNCQPLGDPRKRSEENDCPITVAAGSGSTLLVSGGTAVENDKSMGWPNQWANQVGELTDSDVTLQVKFAKWRKAHPEPHGNVYLTGGLCPQGESCEVVLDGLDLTVDDFSISRPGRNPKFRNVTLTNVYRWVGVKYADGSYEFPNAWIKLTGRMDDDWNGLLLEAPEPVRGRFVTEADGSRYFTLEGRLRRDRVKLDMSLRFRIVGGH